MEIALWLAKVQQLDEVKAKIRACERAEALIAQELREMSNNETFEYEGWAYEKVVRKGSIDYAAIPELKGIDIEQYRKPEAFSWYLRRP